MGGQQSTSSNSTVEATKPKEPEQQEEKKKLKPCCACPETREIRDMCIMEKGQEFCSKEIEDHKECMRKLGFKV